MAPELRGHLVSEKTSNMYPEFMQARMYKIQRF